MKPKSPTLEAAKQALPFPTAEAPALVVVDPPAKPSAPPQVGDVNTAPNTTAEDDLRTLGQRWTNKLWESVQAYIAALVVTVALGINAYLSTLAASENATTSQVASANVANQNINILASLIIGFYFGRVNHQKEAGVGKGDIGR